MGELLTDIFLELFLEKNSDGTKKLRLKGNELVQRINKRLVSSDLRPIVVFMKKHPEIDDLNICYNDIGDKGLIILCNDFLSQPNNLKHLNVMGCDLTAVGLTKLYFTARNSSCVLLKTLRLSSNRLGPNGGHLVALCIPQIPTLEYLDVGDTNQTADSLDNIFLNLWWSKIRVLNINRIVPTSDKIIYDATDLAGSVEELFRLNNTVMDFHAEKCGFDAHDLDLMLIAFKHNTSLLFLDLAYNNLHDFGIELLANWLETRPNLLALNVAGNKFKNSGAWALAKALPSSKIRYLDIARNEVADEGMVILLNTIKKAYAGLFRKLVSKRGPNVKTDRLFLTANPSWNLENGNGYSYKNMPVGVNEVSKWTRESAQKVGLDVEKVKITDQITEGEDYVYRPPSL